MRELKEIVLASGSKARRRMLEAAGLAFAVVPADIDERAIEAQIRKKTAGAEPVEIAKALARAKAEAVSGEHPGMLVVGSDQTLSLGGDLLNKSRTLEDARATLQRLKGREHELHSAVAIAIDGSTDWVHVDSAKLLMRDFSEEFLASYLDRAGESILGSVGAYEAEGLGVQLFERIEGDHFTIFGMPLLPLLCELRRRRAIAS